MTSRREFLRVGLSGGALLLATSGLSRALDHSTPDIYKVIFDERFSESVAFACDMQRRGTPVHGISGDVTALWYYDLHVAWRNAPIHIVGLTTASSLFCLETLARDARHQVTSRQPLTNGLVSWAIGPRELRL
jgi:hypothetical protein